MCTISWFYEQEAYHIFFNRDEQRSRSKAVPPTIFNDAGVEYLAPTDPQGGGTWLSSNSFGLSLALLNFYQGRLPKGKLHSRGQIVKALASCASYREVAQRCNSLPLQKYAPFSLLVFDPAQNLNDAPMLRWDGRELDCAIQSSPLISSAKLFDEVVTSRLSLFKSHCMDGKVNSVEDFYRLHKGHAGGQGNAHSICMHREDAQTVSLSHIYVNLKNKQSNFRYWDGAPCTIDTPQSYQLALL
ncbi:Transport and Golgi organisation 2 [Alteromonadaceae bacterium Bs31]|nr:Transport and Golgi organisation 2 [Alteromonadaceae bacterium Bs31]